MLPRVIYRKELHILVEDLPFFFFSSTELLKSYWVYHSVKLLICGPWAV